MVLIAVGDGNIALANVAANLEAQALRGCTRAGTPLIAALDAMLLDTSDFDRDAAIARAIALAETRRR